MTPGQVYREGANKGVIVGVYLSVIFLCAVLSDYVPLLSLVAILLMLGVPFFIYRIMNFIYKKYQRVADFSSLWMLGIALFSAVRSSVRLSPTPLWSTHCPTISTIRQKKRWNFTSKCRR